MKSGLKSTLRTNFSEVKSVFGYRVRLGNPDLEFENLNPDFPIERTPDFPIGEKLLHLIVSSGTAPNSLPDETPSWLPS